MAPTSGRLPEWLARRLDAAGLMDISTGATRSARVAICVACQARVLRGLCADWGGWSVDADPEPLSALGEALALMAGRPTYELRWLGDRYELDGRDQFRISGAVAGTRAGLDVLVGHQCDGAELPRARTMLRDQLWWTHAARTPEEAPF
jgi:hypothetical protein